MPLLTADRAVESREQEMVPLALTGPESHFIFITNPSQPHPPQTGDGSFP